MHKADGLLLRFGLLIKASPHRSGSVDWQSWQVGWIQVGAVWYIYQGSYQPVEESITDRGGGEKQAQLPVIMLTLSAAPGLQHGLGDSNTLCCRGVSVKENIIATSKTCSTKVVRGGNSSPFIFAHSISGLLSGVQNYRLLISFLKIWMLNNVYSP